MQIVCERLEKKGPGRGGIKFTMTPVFTVADNVAGAVIARANEMNRVPKMSFKAHSPIPHFTSVQEFDDHFEQSQVEKYRSALIQKVSKAKFSATELAVLQKMDLSDLQEQDNGKKTEEPVAATAEESQ